MHALIQPEQFAVVARAIAFPDDAPVALRRSGRFVAAAGWSRTIEDPPTEWIEPATGHHVIRLSREPGSASLYFHQNQYTADGDKMVIDLTTGVTKVESSGKGPVRGLVFPNQKDQKDAKSGPAPVSPPAAPKSSGPMRLN